MKARNREESNAMSSRELNISLELGYWTTAVVMTAFLLFTLGGLQPTTAQETKQTGGGGKGPSAVGQVERGRYIVVGVAACGDCHTPRNSSGELDHTRWLAGAPVPYLAAQPSADWPIVAPRLAGLPPTSDAGIITLLTTGNWITGKPLRSPMPRFHMTRADAEAVLAYLKSLSPGRGTTE
jgi:mono/diheme cytochrome c family protein